MKNIRFFKLIYNENFVLVFLKQASTEYVQSQYSLIPMYQWNKPRCGSVWIKILTLYISNNHRKS